jgi:EmrB/QacA subfamily drug resistance transporter
VRGWRGNPWAVLAVLALGFFMTLLDLTIVNIAIPDMVDRLHASLDEVLWIVNAYTMALATLVVTAGRLGDMRGKKYLFVLGVAVFTLASLLCGLSTGPAELIAFRAVQGVGAALLIPQTLSLLVEVFPAERRGVALGVWGGVAGLAAVAGPTVGGLLVTELDWRWVFFVNLPIGVGVLAAAVRVLPGPRETVRHRFDLTGVAIASAALLCLSFALIEGQRYDWNGWIWTLVGASAVLAGLLLLQQRGRQEQEPLVPFTLFRDRNFSVVNLVGIAVSFGVVGLLLPLTIYLQSVLGFSALKSGLVLVPLALGSAIMAGPAGILSERLGGKYILALGLVAFAAGLVWIEATASVHAHWTAFVAPLLVMGMGAGCMFTPMASEVMRNVPPSLTGAASGLNNALRQVGSVLAGAVVGAILQARLVSSLTHQARVRSASLPEPARERFVAGFSRAGSHGLEVGANQRFSGGLAAQVFGHGFVDALGPVMLVPAGVLVAGALACLALRRPAGPSANPHGLPLLEPENVA